MLDPTKRKQTQHNEPPYKQLEVKTNFCWFFLLYSPTVSQSVYFSFTFIKLHLNHNFLISTGRSSNLLFFAEINNYYTFFFFVFADFLSQVVHLHLFILTILIFVFVEIWLTRWVSNKRQELLSPREYLGLLPVFVGVCDVHLFSFLVVLSVLFVFTLYLVYPMLTVSLQEYQVKYPSDMNIWY